MNFFIVSLNVVTRKHRSAYIFTKNIEQLGKIDWFAVMLQIWRSVYFTELQFN